MVLPREMRARFSKLSGGLRIGADFFERIGAVDEEAPRPKGVVDRLSDLDHSGIDTQRVHPDIAVFFEDTQSLELHIQTHWHFPFSFLWWFLRPFMGWVGQFVMPKERARVLTTVAPLDPDRDGRADARSIIRSYADSGDVMQVIAYATWERSGARYMSAAFPLPGGQIAGFLRLDPIAEDADGHLAVALTSARRNGDDAGIWLTLGPFTLPAPLGEHLEFWSVDMADVPAELRTTPVAGTTIVGRHVQRVFGVRFATHRYWFRPG